MDNISYATATTVSILDPSTKPLHGVWSYHPECHEGRSIFPFEKPIWRSWTHQIYACQLSTLYSKRVENPKGEGQASILIMGILRVLDIWLNILTLEEFLQSLGLLIKDSL
jgi:hypothetical protein